MSYQTAHVRCNNTLEYCDIAPHHATAQPPYRHPASRCMSPHRTATAFPVGHQHKVACFGVQAQLHKATLATAHGLVLMRVSSTHASKSMCHIIMCHNIINKNGGQLDCHSSCQKACITHTKSSWVPTHCWQLMLILSGRRHSGTTSASTAAQPSCAIPASGYRSMSCLLIMHSPAQTLTGQNLRA